MDDEYSQTASSAPIETESFLAQVRDALGQEGPFARGIAGYRVRESQIAMAEAVSRAIRDQEALIVEAATGIGKTFAYLVPSLLSRRRVVISTGTKPLQDQLFNRDLPTVCRWLSLHPKRALLKGRGNYLCLQRLDQQLEMRVLPEDRALLSQLQQFGKHSEQGDLTQSHLLTDEHPLWPSVTSTVDNCLNSSCPCWNDCFVQKARRRAQEAEIVVVNHHLLLADMALRDEGFGELLPDAEVVVIDEAHQLADIAGNFFGVTLGSRSLLDLVHDLQREITQGMGEVADLRPQLGQLETVVLAGISISKGWSGRLAWKNIPDAEACEQWLGDLDAALSELQEGLSHYAEHGPALQQALNRSVLLRSRLAAFREENEDTVAWVESFQKSFVLHRTPLDAAHSLEERRRAGSAAWIFTSASLAVANDFRHAAKRLGFFEEVNTLRLESPFDFRANARLLLPRRDQFDPGHAQYTDACIDWLWPILEGNPGGGFFLFTSHRALRSAATRLRRQLTGKRDVLVQGEHPRTELLRRFRESGTAWLLGAQSFWEGIDLPGEVLTVVIIDKIPFAVPSDPVLQARSARITAENGSPFFEIQLPQAMLALKQGAGRLIRGVDDVGVFVLCDPRVLTRNYGRLILESLPPFQKTSQVDEALTFLRQLCSHPMGDRK